ncbi:MAG: hypothetical protein ACQEXG_07805 [Pseudomonadota bacterium]
MRDGRVFQQLAMAHHFVSGHSYGAVPHGKKLSRPGSEAAIFRKALYLYDFLFSGAVLAIETS